MRLWVGRVGVSFMGKYGGAGYQSWVYMAQETLRKTSADVCNSSPCTSSPPPPLFLSLSVSQSGTQPRTQADLLSLESHCDFFLWKHIAFTLQEKKQNIVPFFWINDLINSLIQRQSVYFPSFKKNDLINPEKEIVLFCQMNTVCFHISPLRYFSFYLWHQHQKSFFFFFFH